MVKLMDDTMRFEDGGFFHYAWPGGYPIYYICEDGRIICPDCMDDNCDHVPDKTDPDWNVIAYDVNWENPYLLCDVCNKCIESAYTEEELP